DPQGSLSACYGLLAYAVTRCLKQSVQQAAKTSSLKQVFSKNSFPQTERQNPNPIPTHNRLVPSGLKH
ncbi:hypothetical protein ACOV11_26285, partial [Vibrio natriegens]